MSEEEGEKGEETTFTAERYIKLERIMTHVMHYVQDILRFAPGVKGEMIYAGNMPAVMFQQASIDVALDLKTILDGGTVPTIAQIVAREKEVRDKGKQRNGDIEGNAYHG